MSMTLSHFVSAYPHWNGFDPERMSPINSLSMKQDREQPLRELTVRLEARPLLHFSSLPHGAKDSVMCLFQIL